ncbi:putative drug exporter of the RND superfamily [Parafrankia irregularis]|uniref:Putative drug exporter of the RND superfamily n=1 Tax=Parafrankia irregularis TaxID=795642 RepID=A0A0S4QPZ5_9ACTN|nr:MULTISPECIES: MMPL family transporter [Parafrankia]MBE3204479.1 MMPL family transporter [Parafrankia sp. CH37]CUU57755.1 putative drug exporter of the RND superfamily [Parafrankia irregularis]
MRTRPPITSTSHHSTRSTHATHLAARAARWSVRHRRLAIGGWFLGVVLLTVLGSLVGTHTLTDSDYGVGEDARAQRTLADHGFTTPASENVLIQRPDAASSPQALLADQQLRAAIGDVAERVLATGEVTNLRAPVTLPQVETEADLGLVSPDRRSVLVTFEIVGDAETATDRIEPVLAAVDAAARAHPGLRVEEVGEASAEKALGDTVGKDFKRAELLAIPLTLGILLAVFGAVVAALIPVVLALTAFVAALGVVAFSSRLLPTDETATSVMLLIGLAVGVDYALFYIRRERAERAAGHSPRQALEIAADTSGHAVLVSGLTVAVSMAGLLITGLDVFSGVAGGTVIVVLIAVLGSLTVLPAVLSWLGDRVELLRLPGRRRVTGRTPAHAAANTSANTGTGTARLGIMGRLLRHPGPVAVVTGGLLVLLALPAFGLRTSEPGIDDLPDDLPIIQSYDRVEAAFPGEQSAAVVVVSADDVRSAEVAAAVTGLRREAVATGVMYEPITTEISGDGRVAKIAIPIAGSGTDDESQRALATLRDTVIPTTVGAVHGTSADVTGRTAGSVDFNRQLNGRTPLVIGFVLVLAFLLLLAAFRSALVAAAAVALNLLSVASAYGLLVVVFQHHWADGLLGYTSTGTITNWLPLMLFVILFGLSMDYQVFVLSRVREAYSAGLPMREAVLAGVRSSAGVVTSAAVIMVAVFSVFATLSQVSMKQLGVGLGAAILLDATVIRVILMPAVLTLIGERAWRRPAVTAAGVSVPRPSTSPDATLVTPARGTVTGE